MRKKWTRLSALLLIFCLFFSLTAFALDEDRPAESEPQTETQQTESPEETSEPPEQTDPVETAPETDPTETEPETEPVDDADLTDEELIEKYHIPNSWSRAALLFAVRNHILYGVGDGTLNPTGNASRAELATILSRLLPTEHSIDLSVFEDMDAGQWYYEPIGHAAAMSLISGTGSTKMSPNALATREQAFVLMARALGMTDGDHSELYAFEDWADVSSWAVPSLAALVEAGYVSGADGKLSPKNHITRQEFAQVVYSIVDRFSDDLQPPLDGLTVTRLPALAPDAVIDGDLLLCSDTTELTLERVTVTGRLILQGVDLLKLKTVGCSIGELVLCRPVEAELDGSVKTVKVTTAGTTLSGTMENVTVCADTVLAGDAQSVTLKGGDLTVSEGASVDTLTVEYSAQGSSVTVNGTVETANIDTEITLVGSGSVKEANVYAVSFEPTLAPETVNFTEDIGLDGIILTGTPAGMPSVDAPKTTVTLTFDGTLPAESCDIYWDINDIYQLADGNVTLTKELELSHEFDFSGDFQIYSNRLMNIRIVCRGREKTFTFAVPVKLVYLMYEVSDVRTLDVPATVNYTTNVYSSSNLTGYKCSVSKGTNVIYRAYVDTKAAQILLPDGTLGWVAYNAITISKADCYTGKDYTTKVKEEWINQKGYGSKTKYLIWCNLYTQRVNVFEGSKGSWKLAFVSQCASGCNYTPTPQEVAQILYKSKQWDYEDFYVHHISVFDSSRGFHSMLYYYDRYELFNRAMGCPASHGCVRMPDEGIMYLWDNVPIGTTVVIY